MDVIFSSDKIVKSKSYVGVGNELFRSGNFKGAIEAYEKATSLHPELENILRFNMVLSRARLHGLTLGSGFENHAHLLIESKKEEKAKLPLTVLVITWDVGHNPLGRSYMLAEALDRVVRNVVLTGFQFERFGNNIWEPVRNGVIPVIPLKGKLFPDLLNEFDHIVEKFKPDVVVACKPRLPSVQLGAMFKEKYGIPLIVDIDDHEMSFVKNKVDIKVDDLLSLKGDLIKNEKEPYSDFWTSLTNDLVKYADAKIVSNVALEREFGGTIIPHVRDEELYNPEHYDKRIQREKFGIPLNAKVLMFFGTPRHHKGVGVLAKAVGEIEDPDFIFVVVGTATDKSVTNKLQELSNGKTINLPNQPFSAIPEIIAMADIVCLPQEVGNETAKYQLPAKAVDAIAMGVPLLVSNTEPLMQLVSDEVADLVDIDNLANVLVDKTNKKRTVWDQLKLRKRFVEKYSYAAAGEILRKMISEVLHKNDRTPCSDLTNLIDIQKKSFRTRVNPINNIGKDVVVFWKQNDTGLYGRRHDMVIKYLSSRSDVRKIVAIDAPISEFDLEKNRKGGALTQGRNVYIKTYEKLLGQLDNDKISYNVFAHKAGCYSLSGNESGRKPLFEGYSKYLEDLFEREKINTHNSVFWFYPKNYLSSEIIDKFQPGKVVVDVVDDHRAWPGLAEEEKKKLTEHYREILASADFSFANCKAVAESMRVFNQNIQLVANGCEELPENTEPENDALYQELKSYQGKVIGFVGNLESKIDISLLEKLATAFPEALIVLVGSTHANPKVIRLARFDNIRMFGVVEYKYVNSIVSKFSVGIVPHLKTDLTENMNPLKVFVYLSNRVPVVTTNVSNIEESEAVLKAKGDQDFIDKVGGLIEGRITCSSNIFDTLVKNNSWPSRLSTYLDKILC